MSKVNKKELSEKDREKEHIKRIEELCTNNFKKLPEELRIDLGLIIGSFILLEDNVLKVEKQNDLFPIIECAINKLNDTHIKRYKDLVKERHKENNKE